MTTIAMGLTVPGSPATLETTDTARSLAVA
jgi:hypothetical protein